MDFFVGVDVGTGSVRAALVTSSGKIKKVATCPLEIFHPAPNFYEQSSDNIWSAVCHVVKVKLDFCNSTYSYTGLISDLRL